MKEKTNMEHLYDLIKDNKEAVEFWHAITKEIDEFKDEKEMLECEKKELEDYLDSINTVEDLECIDFGIGEVLYQQPNNLQLQLIMEDFKEKNECKANFGQISIFA